MTTDSNHTTRNHSSSCGSSPPTVTANGTLAVYDNPLSGVSMQEAYPDVTNGGQVTVTDSSGKIIGTGTLSYSKAKTFSFLFQAAVKYGQTAADLAPDVAIYTFKITDLPGGLLRYGFTVGKGRGTIWVPLSQVKDPGLTLGSLS
jgi:hypothetical protein